MNRLVIIGNGMVGLKVVEELLAIAPTMYKITIIGDEPHPAYNRIMLSPVLSGEQEADEIISHSYEWYDQNNIELITSKAVSINRVRKQVEVENGSNVPYDKLVVATGSDPFIIPVPGHDLEGVIPFRSFADVDYMKSSAEKYKYAVVIGGGLLGLEAANGLNKLGMRVTVVHLKDYLLDRQLDQPAADMLKSYLETQGIRFKMGANTKEIVGSGRAQYVRFEDGTEEAADLVVMAVGVKPNCQLAKDAGVYCNRGIIVGNTLQTFDPNIYAVGECVEHKHVVYGLVAPLYEQAKVCATHLAEFGIGMYNGSVTSTKLKITGVDVFSAGEFDAIDSEVLVLEDKAQGLRKRLSIQNNTLVGAVLYGDVTDAFWYDDLIRKQTDISSFRDTILLGNNHLGDSGHGGVDTISKMADDHQVCGCNGVCKGDIVSAIKQQHLTTVAEVKKCTRAGTGCGGCTGLVEQVLLDVTGQDFEVSEPPLCECTQYSDREIKQFIANHPEVPTVQEVKDALDFSGQCKKCGPAINYYLLVQYPNDYVDNANERYVNERMHANVQADQTFSVIPEMKGGLTNSNELRVVADIVDKYEIPLVKLTGGQRVDMLGVKKEQLNAVWQDLADANMHSGYAYGKAMRTCKSCVGKGWCPVGTQDSMTLAVRLEEATRGLWTPHKYKMGVSGCPRNCSEATIKDFGVVCTKEGYEIHIAGACGARTKATQVLAFVKTEDEVVDYCQALTQLYRSEGYYMERVMHYEERVGLEHIKSSLDTQEKRDVLKSNLPNQPSNPWEATDVEVVKYNPDKDHFF